MILSVGHILFRAERKAKDCYEWKHKYHEHKSGVYNVYAGPDKTRIRVYCDMETDGGGWTVCSEMFSINCCRNSLLFYLSNFVLLSKVLLRVIKVACVSAHVIFRVDIVL